MGRERTTVGEGASVLVLALRRAKRAPCARLAGTQNGRSLERGEARGRVLLSGVLGTPRRRQVAGSDLLSRERSGKGKRVMDAAPSTRQKGGAFGDN
jgi:hypothetical protein